MAFIDIKDPRQRDKLVADYLNTIKHVQQQNEDERAVGLAIQVDLETTFNPVIKATEKSTKAITKELIPLREEIKNINKPKPPAAASRKRTWDVTNGLTAIDYYLNKYGQKGLDKYYGIQQDDDKLVMGDKDVTVDDDSNISVDDVTYKGTPGLWMLIMTASPNPKSYTNEDFENYRDLVKRTNVMQHPRGIQEGISRPAQTYKRKVVLEKVMADDAEEEEEEGSKLGTGIQFLPGDIKGLHTRLNLLLAEYVAGNRSTRNEIVGILDELKRRKSISRKEYTDINSFLAKTL